jgi:hypothetical protein
MRTALRYFAMKSTFDSMAGMIRVDLTLQASSFAPAWRRWRWLLWLAGTLFALLVATYWIGDEIYPSVSER